MKYLVTILILFAVSCQKSKDPDPDPVPVCQIDLSKGLIAYYPFNGNFNDESGNGNNAVPKNGATLGLDMFGRQLSAAKFDGINDYLFVASNPKLDSDTLSVSLNVMVNTINRRHTLVNRAKFENSTSMQWGIGQSESNQNNYSFAVPDKAEDCSKVSVYDPKIVAKSNVTTQVAKWYNVVCTFGKTGQKIYIDGVLVDSIARTFSTLKKCPAADLLIGGWWSSDIISIDGKIDDVRIYNREIGKCEIAELAKDAKKAAENSPYCDPDLNKGLLAWYPFNGNMNDESGNGNNGTAFGAALTTDFLGRQGRAAGFDGVNDYILINDNGKLNSDTVTVSLVVMLNNVGPSYGFLDRVSFTDAKNFSYGLGTAPELSNAGHFSVGPNDGCGKSIVYNESYYAKGVDVLIPGRWYHMIGVFANGKQQFYIDGKLVRTQTRTFPNLLKCTGQQQLVLGAWWQGGLQAMNGKLDDVRIYNRALNDCEIAKLTKIFKE